MKSFAAPHKIAANLSSTGQSGRDELNFAERLDSYWLRAPDWLFREEYAGPSFSRVSIVVK